MYNVKISPSDITHGPQDFELDELAAFTFAGDLHIKGYRRVSSAYCCVARIDREDWLEVLARHMHCAVANYYCLNGSGVQDRWRDYYIRTFSRDTLTVSPAIYRKMKSYH